MGEVCVEQFVLDFCAWNIPAGNPGTRTLPGNRNPHKRALHNTVRCCCSHVRAINGIINPYLQNSDSEKRQRGLADCAFQNTGHSTVEGYGLLAFVLLKT